MLEGILMDNFLKAMTYNFPDEIPMRAGIMPAIWLRLGEEMVRFAKEYPDFIPDIPDLNRPEDYIPATHHVGSYTDEWGCVWSNIGEGMFSIVTGHPVPDREDINNLKIPENRNGSLPHGFMYLRLLDLRGFEEAMIDFAEEPDELQVLIDKVLEYNCRQIEVAVKDENQIIHFGDDLGIQNGLAISPGKWRKYLKPCYKKMYSIVHEAGKYVYMHTDGMIYEIIPDLAECGVDIINPEIGPNGPDNLARVCKGKYPLEIYIDSQMLPFATPWQIESHVRECVEALYLPQGGLALIAELNYEIPLQNCAAALDSMRKYKYYGK